MVVYFLFVLSPCFFSQMKDVHISVFRPNFFPGLWFKTGTWILLLCCLDVTSNLIQSIIFPSKPVSPSDFSRSFSSSFRLDTMGAMLDFPLSFVSLLHIYCVTKICTFLLRHWSLPFQFHYCHLSPGSCLIMHGLLKRFLLLSLIYLIPYYYIKFSLTLYCTLAKSHYMLSHSMVPYWSLNKFWTPQPGIQNSPQLVLSSFITHHLNWRKCSALFNCHNFGLNHFLCLESYSHPPGLWRPRLSFKAQLTSPGKAFPDSS